MDRRLALAGLLAFVAVVVLQHVLEPQLGPARHTISEYVNTRTGVLMTAGFVVWSGSLAATAALVWRERDRERSAARPLLAGALAIASAGMLVTACFATQTSAGIVPAGTRRTASGHVHDLASLAAQEALLVGVVASIVLLWRRSSFRATASVLLATAVVASAVLLSIGDPVDGIRQRVLVAAGCTWQAALILTVARRRER